MSHNIDHEKLDALTDSIHSHQQEHAAILSDVQKMMNALPNTLENINRKAQETELKMNNLFLAESRPGTASIEHKMADQGFSSFLRKGDMAAMEAKDMSSGSGEDGGFLVPEQLSKNIHEKLAEHSFMRKIARVANVSSDSFESLVATKNADVGWTDGKTADATGSPQFKKIKIQNHSLYARLSVTQKLIDDASVNIEEWVTHHVIDQMAAKENEAFLSGDGEGKPKGLLTNIREDAIQSIKTGANGTFSQDSAEKTLFDLVGHLKTPYLQNACWIMSRSAEAAVRKLKDPNQMHYLWQPALGADKRPSLLGYPVYVTDFMPALKENESSNSILFGNFREAYQITDRQDIQILRDQYSNKPFVEFYTTKRVGGDVINPEAAVALTFGE